MHAPAELRRRRLVALAVPASIALIAGIIVGADDSEAPIDQSRLEPAIKAADDAELLGSRLMVRMDGVATPSLLRAAKRGEIGGVIVFPGESLGPAEVRPQIRSLQRAASEGGQPPLLVATDQEGGSVSRFRDGPPGESAADLADRGVEGVRSSGRATGEFLAAIGINLDLAPVLDVGHPRSYADSRAFGGDAASVSALGGAFAAGLADGGVLASAKHFPGLGRAEGNTDFGIETIAAPADQLEQDLSPFRDAVAAGVPLVMVASAVYPAYDPASPAVFSREVSRRLLRDELGFTGATISDDLNADAITAIEEPGRAAVRAARAGIDILLFARPGGVSKARRALSKALEAGRLRRSDLELSYGRILSLRNTAGSGGRDGA